MKYLINLQSLAMGGIAASFLVLLTGCYTTTPGGNYNNTYTQPAQQPVNNSLNQNSNNNSAIQRLGEAPWFAAKPKQDYSPKTYIIKDQYGNQKTITVTPQ